MVIIFIIPGLTHFLMVRKAWVISEVPGDNQTCIATLSVRCVRLVALLAPHPRRTRLVRPAMSIVRPVIVFAWQMRSRGDGGGGVATGDKYVDVGIDA